MSPFTKISIIHQKNQHAPSEKELAIKSTFGLTGSQEANKNILDIPLPKSGITLITGFSGSGKSSLLKAVLNTSDNAVVVGSKEIEQNVPIIDLFSDSVSETVAWLSKFGLAEPQTMCTLVKHLSTGQFARLELALAMHDKPRVIIADEFMSTLDRLNAKSIAFRFQKLCRDFNITAYLATAHDDLATPLSPDHLIELDFNKWHKTKVDTPPFFDELEKVVITEGKMGDYRNLEHFHYVDSNNEIIDWESRITEIRTAHLGEKVIATAVYTKPFSLAFEKLPIFNELNRKILLCHRVIVHPTFRNLGIFSNLLPLETKTAAVIVGVSAMGQYFPFYRKANFDEAPHPRLIKTPEHDELELILKSITPKSLHLWQSIKHSEEMFKEFGSEEQARITNLVIHILERDNIEHCKALCQIVGFSDEVIDSIEKLRPLIRRSLESASDSAMPSLITQAMHFPMHLFFKHI